ncbi:hypothetical protein C8Q73DRAFT_788224 [Cubamyces lactineus]|nr:hypothetical protein C8Q73DRAFT_788224 [Cubamyces lactineus]
MAKDLTSTFKNPDHFAPVKGRGGRVYCKLCTPPDRPRGQPMTVAAAVRHETENRKHQEKIKENALWDWNHQLNADWATPYVPQGESAWEYDPYTSERLTAYVNFWLEGIEIAERGEQPPTMDVFISRYDNLYQEENWGLKYGERVEEEEEEWPAEECEGVEGYYYDGGSFEPFDEGDEHYEGNEEPQPQPHWMQDKLPPYVPSHSSESILRRAREEKWWPDDPDPCKGWGSVVNEETPWSNVPQTTMPQLSHGSDATPETQSSSSAGSWQQVQRRRRRPRASGRGRGKGSRKEKTGHVPNSKVATHRVETQWRAKVY